MQLDPFTTIKDDLGGAISVKFKEDSSFQTYCEQHIPNFDAQRLEVLAMRCYYGKEIDITIYAVDKDRRKTAPEGEIPVKKIKVDMQFLQDILPHIEECNFTITTGEYPLEGMKVINK